MANKGEGEQEEVLKTEIIGSETLFPWDRIQLTPIRARSQSLLLLDPNNGRGAEWSMSIANEDHRRPSVFPPSNHEGLDLGFCPHPHHHDVRQIDPDEGRAPPSHISSPQPGPEARAEFVAIGWWNGLVVLQFKLARIVSWLRNFCATRGLLRSLHFPLAGSLLLLLLYLRFRRRRRLQRECIVGLIRVIKEKDERIHQLLHQIARMNEILLATHHGVTMVSKATSA